MDSALAQTDPDFELLFVDDASTDGSAALVRERYGHDPRVRVLALEHNGGAGHAANAGVAAARGAFIGFLDSDDEWLPEFLATSLRTLDANPSAALAFCDYVEIWEPWGMERVIMTHVPDNQREGMLAGGFVHSMTLTLMRKSAFRFAGQFEPNYSVSHDFYLWLRLALELDQPFVHVRQPLARHYRSADGVTTRHQIWLEEYHDALNRGYEHVRAREFAALKPRALHKVALGIVARRKTGEWLERTSGATVGVVIEAHGSLTDVQRALECVEAQSYARTNVVVVNNGADDDAAAWLDAGVEREQWQHLRLPGRTGRGAAFNLGAIAAPGELLAFLDCAHIWEPDFLQAQVRANSYVSGAALYSVCDAAIGSASEVSATLCGATTPRDRDRLLATWRHPPVSLPTLVCRRDRFLQAGGFTDALDAALSLELTLKLLSLTDPGGDAPAHVRHVPVRIPIPLVRRLTTADPASQAREAEDWLSNAAVVLQRFLDSAEPNLGLLEDEVLDALRQRARQLAPDSA